eukprot:4234904-Pleurochrysis_carterae.AAC.1
MAWPVFRKLHRNDAGQPTSAPLQYAQVKSVLEKRLRPTTCTFILRLHCAISSYLHRSTFACLHYAGNSGP